MPLDTSIIGTRVPSHSATVERGRLRFFAKAIGQVDPVYGDLGAARAVGHPDLPVPPTFLFCLNMETPDPFAFYATHGIDLRTILHGEQSFIYHAMAYAGDVLTFSTHVSDVYAKRGGALQFLVRTTEVFRGDDHIATLHATTVIRELEGSRA